MRKTIVVPAHEQTVTIHVEEFVPAHDTRETDPAYGRFDAIRRAWEKAGKLVCDVCGRDEKAAGQPIELHHRYVEFSLANLVDWRKFAAHHPQFGIASQEDFDAFVESDANLQALCKEHHTGDEGVHEIPYPLWELLPDLKDGVAKPFRVITQGEEKDAGN